MPVALYAASKEKNRVLSSLFRIMPSLLAVFVMLEWGVPFLYVALVLQKIVAVGGLLALVTPDADVLYAKFISHFAVWDALRRATCETLHTCRYLTLSIFLFLALVCPQHT